MIRDLFSQIYVYICSGGAALAYMAVDEALDGVTGAWHDTLPPGKHQLAVHLPSAEGRDVDKQVQLLRPRRPTLPPHTLPLWHLSVTPPFSMRAVPAQF